MSSTAQPDQPTSRRTEQPAETRTEQAAATRTERPAGRPGAAAIGARAAGGVFLTLSRLVKLAAAAVALLIALGIVLYDAKANPSNGIVKAIHDAANWLTTPFHGLFSIHGPRAMLSLNWGIALVVYLIAGTIIAALIASPAGAMRPFRRP